VRFRTCEIQQESDRRRGREYGGEKEVKLYVNDTEKATQKVGGRVHASTYSWPPPADRYLYEKNLGGVCKINLISLTPFLTDVVRGDYTSVKKIKFSP